MNLLEEQRLLQAALEYRRTARELLYLLDDEAAECDEAVDVARERVEQAWLEHVTR